VWEGLKIACAMCFAIHSFDVAGVLAAPDKASIPPVFKPPFPLNTCKVDPCDELAKQAKGQAKNIEAHVRENTFTRSRAMISS
jgi:hypothetical protein